VVLVDKEDIWREDAKMANEKSRQGWIQTRDKGQFVYVNELVKKVYGLGDEIGLTYQEAMLLVEIIHGDVCEYRLLRD